MRTVFREGLEAFEQQPDGKHDFRRETNLGLPARGRRPRHLLEAPGFLQQRATAPIEHFAGRGERGFASFDFEGFDPELRLQLLDGIAHRGLAFVHGFSRLRIAAAVHHLDQGPPLV